MAEKKRGSKGGESFHPEGGKAFNLGRIFMGISEDYAARHLSHEKEPRDFVPHYTQPKQHPLFRGVPKAELDQLTDAQAANILAMAHAEPVKAATPPGVRPDGKPDFNHSRKFHAIDKLVGAMAAPVRGAIHAVGLHTEDVVGHRQGDIPFEYNGHRGKFLYNSLVHHFARFAGEMLPETMAEALPLPVSAYLFRHQEGLAHGMDRLLSPLRFSTQRDREAAIAKQVAHTAYLNAHPEAAASEAARQTAPHWHYADSADALEAHLAGHHNIPFKQTLREYFRKRVIDPTGTPRGNREDDTVPGDLPAPVAAAADVAPGEGGHHGGLKSGYVHMRPAAATGIGLAAGMAAGGVAGEPAEAAPESTVDAHAMDTAGSLGELKSQSQADLFAQLIGAQIKTNAHLDAITQILERLVEATDAGREEAKESAEQKEASEHREKHGKKDAHGAAHAKDAHATGHPTATVGKATAATHPVSPDAHADPVTAKAEVETLKQTEQHVAAQAKDTAKVVQGVAATNQHLAGLADILNAGFGFRTMNTAMMRDAQKAFGLKGDTKAADKLGTAALDAKKVKDHASAVKEAAHLYALKKLLGGAATGAATAGAGAAAAGAAEGTAGAAAGAAEGVAGAGLIAGLGAALLTPAGIGLLIAGTVAGVGAYLQHRRNKALEAANKQDSNSRNPAGHIPVKPPQLRGKGPDGLPLRTGITDYYDKHPQYRPQAHRAARGPEPAVPATLHAAAPHQEIAPFETPDGQYLTAGETAPQPVPVRTFSDANRDAITFWQKEVSAATWADHDDGSTMGRVAGRTNDAISYWQHRLDGTTPTHRSAKQAQADAHQSLWARVKSRTADAYHYWHGDPHPAAPGPKPAAGQAPLLPPFAIPKHATRGVRNNNPGNVEQDQHNPWLGTTHNGREHRFAVFTKPEYGVRALAKNLLAYQDKHHLMTLRQIIARHAPPKENNTAAYVAAVSKATGLNPDAKINLHDAATMEKVSAAIIAHENAGFHYPDAVLKRGISMAEGGHNAADVRIAHDAHVPGANAHNVHATARHVSGQGMDPFSTVKAPPKFGQTATEQAKTHAARQKKEPSFWDKLANSAKGLVDSTRHLFFAPVAGEDVKTYAQRVDATLAGQRRAHTDMYGHVNPLLARMQHAGHQAVNDVQAGAHRVGEIAHAMGEQARGMAGNAVNDAQKMLGKSARVNDTDLKEYLKTGGVHMDPAKAAWCAAFVNASLGHEGIKGTGSLTANSFQTWGQAVKPNEVKRGDVVLNTRGHAAGQVGGHVGMATGRTRMQNGELQVEMIAGNSGGHGGAVRTTWEPANQRMIRRATSDDLPQAKMAGGPDRVVSQQSLDGHAFGKNSGVINAAISRASSATGVSALDMATMLKIEDGSGNLHAVSSTGAKGLYQFTSKTGAKYGLHGADFFDPNKNATAAAHLWQDNVKGINTYNARHPDNPIPVTGWTAYLAHQEGVAGLTNIWEAAHGQAPLKSGVRRNMDVNGGKGLTPAQFMDHWAGKWDHYQGQLHRDDEKVPQQQKGTQPTQEVENGTHPAQTAEQLAAQDRAVHDAYAQVGRATAAGYRSQYGPSNAPDSAARDQSINDAYAQVGRATGTGYLSQYGATHLPDSLARDQSIHNAYAQVGRATAAGFQAPVDPRFSTASSLAGTAAGMLGGNAFSTVTAAATSHQMAATMNHFSDSLDRFSGHDFIQHPEKAAMRMVNPMGQVMNDAFAPGVGGMVGGGMGAGGNVGAVGQDGGMPVVSGDNTEMRDNGPDQNQVSYNSDSHSSSISTITGATMMDNDQTNETNKAPVDIGSIGLLLFNSSLL